MDQNPGNAQKTHVSNHQNRCSCTDNAVRVESVHENGQARGNTKLLGKYQVRQGLARLNEPDDFLLFLFCQSRHRFPLTDPPQDSGRLLIF